MQGHLRILDIKTKDGFTILEGDLLGGEYSEDRLRFLYLITEYEGSFLKPYIMRQVENGPYEVVGRSNQEIDISQFILVRRSGVIPN